MPERSTVATSNQIGPEVTPGTSVAASKLLNSLSIETAPQFEAIDFRPMGQKFRSIVVPGKEWMQASLGGPCSYGESVYPLCSVLVNVSPATVDTTARSWTFTPAARTEDTVKTYTIEQGSSVRAHKFTYGLVTEYNLEFTRNGVDQSGTMIAQRLQDGITMTASPTAVEEKPVLPTHVDCWIDATSGGLGGTQMNRAFRVALNMGDRFNPVWPLNSTLTSFGSHVESEPTVNAEVTLEADATGMGFLVNARAGDTRFVRVKATSTENAGATTTKYSLQADFALKIASFEFGDEDGVYTVQWSGPIVYDATWTKAVEIVVVNKVAAL